MAGPSLVSYTDLTASTGRGNNNTTTRAMIVRSERGSVMDFISIDFETANLDPTSACAVGLAVVSEGQILRTAKYFIRPPRIDFKDELKRIHGIGVADVIDAPRFDEIWPNLADLIGDHPLVAHNARFEIRVFRSLARFYGLTANHTLRVACSLELARQIWRGLRSYALSYLVEELGITGFCHHDPSSDALAAAQIVLKAAHQCSCNSLFSLCDQCQVQMPELVLAQNATSPKFCKSACTDWRIVIPEEYDVATHPLYGKNIVFTGELEFMERCVAEHLVGQLGATACKSVTKRTNYLVATRNDTRKFHYAQELRAKGIPIQIMDEATFRDLVKAFLAPRKNFGEESSDVAF